MTDYKKLIANLRDEEYCAKLDFKHYFSVALAADAIEQLVTDIDVARKERDELVGKINKLDERPHGHWIEKEKYAFGVLYDCSLCENRILDNGRSWNFCPNCGAKMEEVSE